MRRLLVGAGGVLGLAGAAAAFVMTPPALEYEPTVELESTFEAFARRQLAESEAEGVRRGNDEKLLRFDERTPYAILYIHGFGASRAEGELVIDALAERLQANTWYVRLPGHGSSAEAQAATTHVDYLNEVEEAFRMMPELGDEILVVGCSTGGLLATWLASRHADEMRALVLASPLYAFADPTAKLLDLRGGLGLAKLVMGPDRDTSVDPSDPRYAPDYADYWLTHQKMDALRGLADLRRYAATDETYRKNTVPTLLMHYYRDEEHQDSAVSVLAMRDAFERFGGTPHNRLVAIENGEHVLMSEYVQSDKEAVNAALYDFLDDVGVLED